MLAHLSRSISMTSGRWTIEGREGGAGEIRRDSDGRGGGEGRKKGRFKGKIFPARERRSCNVGPPFHGMLIKRILCGEDAILNNVDQSEAELARLGGVAGAPAKGETRAERATTTSCSNANYPYIMPYRKPPPSPPSATLRTSDHPFLPLRLESDVPSKFGFPISSIFLGSYLSIYIYIYIAEWWRRTSIFG